MKTIEEIAKSIRESWQEVILLESGLDSDIREQLDYLDSSDLLQACLDDLELDYQAGSLTHTEFLIAYNYINNAKRYCMYGSEGKLQHYKSGLIGF